MIRSTLLRHGYLCQPHTLLCGGSAAMQQPSGSHLLATVLWQVLGAEIDRSDRGISDEKFNLVSMNSGWRGRRTPK